MAGKRSGKQTNAPKKRRKKPGGFGNHLVKVGMGIAILIAIVAGSFALLYYYLPGPPFRNKVVDKHIPTYEIYPEEKQPKEVALPPKPAPMPVPLPGKPLPMMAIIIDDIGYDSAIADKFIKLGEPLTLSFLPQGPFTRKIAKRAEAAGTEMMLHLPMEPKEYPTINPGPGALLVSMTPDELIAQLDKDIDAVPNIKGVNNHMGSKMTADSAKMYQIFSVIKANNLYFIDSLTSPDSVGESSARLFRVPFRERDVFIDHVQDPDFIKGQIELLMRIAEKYGNAVGIAHPHEVTYQVLDKMMPELKKRVKIVPASELVYQPS